MKNRINVGDLVVRDPALQSADRDQKVFLVLRTGGFDPGFAELVSDTGAPVWYPEWCLLKVVSK